MTARLATHMLVSMLVRRVEALGGFAAIVHRGDRTSGTILVQCLEKGRETGLFERVSDHTDGHRLVPCGPPPESEWGASAQYIARRRKSDPDLWLIELDIADAERLAVESLA
ncbi:MAG: DUF1491 family protein [Sphingobium sp.]|uniref:DUF1491 family protein n=1 Tax=Sphingobium sp. TaxID=1912891 RepID=UPI0029AD598D|nr:DUF1491 family protein [Sphingobium sp.]MDX3909215.1 DUF1491 family protein [Sphingobium sp.]